MRVKTRKIDKKAKRRLYSLLFILVIFCSSPILNNLFSPNLSAIVERDVETDFDVFQNMAHIYSGMFYDDTDPTFAWTTAKIEFQHTDTLFTEENGEWDVTEDLTNSESKYASGEENLAMTEGIYTDFNNISSNDDDYARFDYYGVGMYNATYSFEDELDGTSGDAIGFVDDDLNDASCTTTIISNLDGHKKVLQLEDNNVAGRWEVGNDFSFQDYGTVEFWVRTDDPTYTLDFGIKYDFEGSLGVQLRFDADKIIARDGGAYTTVLDPMLANTWYHIRIAFDCDGDGYEGISGADKWKLWIDGVYIGEYGFRNNKSELGNLIMYGLDGDSGYHYYLGAIDYSWDPFYEEGRNREDLSVLGHYPATYSFDDQSVGTSGDDIDYVHSTSFDDVVIIAEYLEHKKVLHISSSAAGTLYHYYDATHVTGAVEFYFKSISGGTYWNLRALNGEWCVQFRMRTDRVEMQYGDGTGGSLVKTYYFTTNFPHYKIEFDCVTDTYSAWCESVLVVNNLPFLNDVDGDTMNRERIYTSTAFELYADAIGYSWDEHYLIGDNFNDNFYLGYENFEQYNKTEIGDYYGTESFDYNTEEGVYYGTHDFRDEVDEEGLDIDFVDNYGAGEDCHAKIIEEKLGHKKVLEVYDNNSAGGVSLYHYYDTMQIDATVEFWWAYNGTLSYLNYLNTMYYEGSTECVRIIFGYTGVGQIMSHDGTAYVSIVSGLPINTFYHIKIVFDDSANTFNFYLDGVDKGMFVYKSNSTVGISKIRMETRSNGIEYAHWLDAWGENWDATSHSGLGYRVGWNINPYDLVPILEDGLMNLNRNAPQIGWESSLSCVPWYDGHKNVFNITKGTPAVSSGFYIPDNSDGENGAFEFWWQTNDTIEYLIFLGYTNAWGLGYRILLGINNKIQAEDGGGFVDVVSVSPDTWYHIKIAFECGAGGYDGLAGDTYYVYVNGTQYGAYDFPVAGDEVNFMNFNIGSGQTDVSHYLDAVGMTWDANYDVGDNINSHGKDVITALESEGWTYEMYPYTSIGISGEFNSHKKFLNLTDDSELYFPEVNDVFSAQTSGTIEMWWRTTDNTKRSYILVRESSVNRIRFRISEGTFWHYGSGWVDTTVVATNDVWYHIRIDFDCTLDTFDLYINDVLSADDIAFVATTFINTITLQNRAEDFGYSTYFDAISYSWEEPIQYFRGSYNQHCEIEAIMDFTIVVLFTDYERFFLQVNIDSRHYTSTYTNVTWLFYNFTLGSWVEITDYSAIVETLREHDDSDVVNGLNGLFDSSGNMKFRYYCYNSTAFYLEIDELSSNTYFGTEFEYEHTIEALGAWRYRFKLDVGLGTEYIQDWIYFDVVESTASKTIYKDKPYTFELHDFWDSADRYHKYTSANFQTGLSPATLSDYAVDPFYENYETELGDPDNIIVSVGTSDYADNMEVLDSSYTLWTASTGSTTTTDLIPDVKISEDGWYPDAVANIIYDDELYIQSGTLGAYAIYSVSDFSLPLGTASGIQVWVLGRRSLITGDIPGASYRIGGGAPSSVVQMPFGTSFHWLSATYSGLSLSQSDVNDLQVRMTIEVEGTGGYPIIDRVLLRLTYETVAPELSTEISMQFTDADVLDDKLSLKVSSTHKTNIATTLDYEIYNFDTTSWDTIHSGSATSFTERPFSTTSYSDYLNSTNHIRLKYSGTNALQFQMHVDYLWAELYAKLDLEYTITFTEVGTYLYRWEVTGSLYYTNYVLFEVIDAPSNFYAISESDQTTRWILQDNELTAVQNFHDDINTTYWNLDDVSKDSFESFLDESYLLDNYTFISGNYTGTHFDVGAQNGDPRGITWDGTYFWVVGEYGSRVYKYTSAGVYTETHFDVGAQVNAPFGIEWDGTHFWMVGWNSKEVYKYTSAGVYTGTHFDVGAQDNSPIGITWDGTYFWMVGEANDEVYKYTLAGVYTGTHFDVGAQEGNPAGIEWDGTHFWVVGQSGDRSIFRYTSAGVYTGNHFDVEEDMYPFGITWDGAYFWIVGYENDEVYKYFPNYKIYKNYFGDNLMYMQTNKTELISLKSIDYGTYYNLSSGDYFEIDFQTSSDSKINVILLKDGVVNKTLTLSQSGNTNFDRHTAKISVGEFVGFDQLKVSSTFEDTDNVKVYDIKTYKYTVVGDSADFYVGSRRDYEVYLTPDVYNLRINENGDEKINTNVTVPATGVLQYIYTPTETLDCRLALFNTVDESLEFTDYHIKINRSLNNIYNDFWLLEPIFSADEDTYVYIDVYDRFNTLIDSFERLASEYIDLELEVYSLQIKNLQTQKTTLDINSTHVYPLLSGDSIYFMLSTSYYKIGYYDTNDVYKQFTIYLNSNQAYELNRSKICFLSYADQQGNHLYFENYKTYLNGSLLYENVFYREIGDNIGIEIKDRYGISIKNETYTVVSGDNYIPITLTMYSLKVMNQQEIFNWINITRDPNYYESSMYWSEWIAPTEIIEFKLFAGYYKINLTNNENGGSSYYSYTLNGDDVLLISSGNTISNLIINIANVNTTIGNQITNVQIDLTNQNSEINNTIVNIVINLENVNSSIGNLLTNINLDIININNNISNLYTFTENNFLNLGNNINNSFISIENNIIAINQTISTLVIGLDGKITIVNATINTMFTEMNSQFIVVQSTLDFSFAFLNQTIIQIGNNITTNQIALNNLIIQRANEIDNNLIQITNLINLLNSSVANESLVVQTLVNIIGSNITENHVIINNLINLLGNNITENNINLVSLIELVGNNITTNQFVIQTLIDYVSNNITYNHLELLTNINFINNTMDQNQIELINRLLFINNSINQMALDLTNQIIFVNDTIYSAVLSVSTSIDFNSDCILGNISLTYQQNDFLTQLYKKTMFSQLLNWSGVAYNYSLMEDRIDVWDFVNNYRNQSIEVHLRYQDIIDSLIITAQNSILQYLPRYDTDYNLWSIKDQKYLDEWQPLPENRTVSFGFYEEEIPDVPDFNAPGIWLMIILILMGCGFAIAFIGYVAYRYRKKSENYRRSYADKVTLEAQTIKKFSQGTRIR